MKCVACGKWIGSRGYAAHGLAHVRRNEVCLDITAARYEFYLPPMLPYRKYIHNLAVAKRQAAAPDAAQEAGEG